MKAFLALMTPTLKGIVLRAEMDLVKANMLLLLVLTGAVIGSCVFDISLLLDNHGAGNDEAEESEDEDEQEEERDENDKSEGEDESLLSSSFSPMDGNCIFSFPSIFLKNHKSEKKCMNSLHLHHYSKIENVRHGCCHIIKCLRICHENSQLSLSVIQSLRPMIISKIPQKHFIIECKQMKTQVAGLGFQIKFLNSY